MRKYVLRRLLIATSSLFLASLVVFSLPRMIPGDVVQLMLEERAYGKDLEDLRAKLGLNRPIHIQYFEWAGRVVRGELGESLWTKRPVLEELGRRLPVSLKLGLARSLAIVGLSVPGFWIATMVILLPSLWWNWSPPIQFTEFSVDPWAHVSQFIIPAFILGIASSAAIMRLTRAQLLEVLRQDYVRTAWAKGVRESAIVLKHSLKNSLIPVITVLGIQIAQILGGTVIFETIFGLPGMGRFLFDAINQRDYPVIQGVNLVIVSVVVLMNLAVDACYAYLDPRIRY